MRRSWASLFFLIAIALATPVVARAEDAETLIKQGVELRRQGKDQEALETFQRAYALGPTGRALAQIGLAEQALGRWPDAEAHISKALEAASAEPWVGKNRAPLEASLAAIGQHLGSLEVLGPPAGAELRIDGQRAVTFPQAHPVRLNAGSVVIEIRAPGRTTTTRTVNVVAGQLTRETFVLQPAVPAVATEPAFPGATAPAPSPRSGTPIIAAAPAEQPAPARSGRRTAAWITAGAAAAAAIAGGAGLVVRELDARRYNQNHCALNASAECKATRDEGNTATAIGIGGLIVAGALGIASGVLFYYGLGAPASTAESKLGLACVPDLSGRGVACAAHF